MSHATILFVSKIPRTMYQRLTVMCIAAVLYASPAKADMITYQLLGEVTQTDAVLVNYMPGIVVGTPIDVLITWDPQQFLLTEMVKFFVGDFLISGSAQTGGASTTHPEFFWSAGTLGVQGPLAHSFSPGGSMMDFGHLEFDVANQTGSLLLYGLDLLACPVGTLGTCDDTPGFTGSFDTVNYVPEPGSAFSLMMIGLGTLIGCRRAIRTAHRRSH